jgi:hypothetical protein
MAHRVVALVVAGIPAYIPHITDGTIQFRRALKAKQHRWLTNLQSRSALSFR